MDKMIQKGDNDVIITNDGATILSEIQVSHPAAKMIIELSKSQDVEAGDGTTSVVVLAGSLLNVCTSLLSKGIHPSAITVAFQRAARQAEQILTRVAIPVIIFLISLSLSLLCCVLFSFLFPFLFPFFFLFSLFDLSFFPFE